MNLTFNTGSLIGKYPSVYKAAAMRNPVTNLCSMFGSTDIPDWCYAELGLDPNKELHITPEINKLAFERSPISLVNNVQAKTLIAVGDADLRVPVSNAVTFV